MEQPESNQTIKDSVLNAIAAGKVTMKPRWHFVLRAALMATGLVLAVLVALYLVSFIIFVLRQNGTWFLSINGVRGLGQFMFALPWLLVMVAIIFTVLLEIFVRKYSFAYGKPLLYSVLGVLLLVVVGGFVIAKTPLHPGLFEQARNSNLPVAGGLYREYGMHRLPENLTAGRIVEVYDNGLQVEARNEDLVKINFTDTTEFVPDDDFDTEDMVVVVGVNTNGEVVAEIVKLVENPPRMWHMGGGQPFGKNNRW